MKRLFWLTFFATATLWFGCSNTFEYRPGYITRFSCLDYFTQQELDCLKGTAWRCKEAGLTRDEARVMLRYCYMHNPLIVAERAFCLDDALDLYYDPVKY